jgi:hypothetical protein
MKISIVLLRSGGLGAPGLASQTGVRRIKTILAATLLLPVCFGLAAQAIDCTHATVLSAQTATIPEQTAIAVLLEESARRTGEQWQTANAYPTRGNPGCLIVAATAANLPSLLPPTLQRVDFKTPEASESFSINTFPWHGRQTIVIEGRDGRGLLYGVGYLLRTIELSSGKATLPLQLHIAQTPEKSIRGHQLGYRFKSNTYDAWNLAQFEQYIRELAIFGANTIQLIAPDSDDASTSPLYPAPALDTLLGISKILEKYGLDCSIFYPEMEPDYAKPEDFARELTRFEALFRQIPRVDSIWIPGGDPGHTPPNLLFPLVAQEAAILHKYHPNAKIYLSAQGMDAAQYEDFYRLAATKPAWLSGIFFGPQSRDSFETQRRRIPAALPILFYPDIAHTMHAQFPVPEWDPAYALTEGREPIDPRPVDEAVIYKHFEPLQSGFTAYSEGVNDDGNKFLWTQWSWNSSLPAEAILQDYSRFFLGPQWTQPFAKGLADLERNWRGPLLKNPHIEATAAEFEEMEQQSAAPKLNWRFELALERAHYDLFLQQRLTAETAQQQQALAALAQAPQTGSEKALASAESALIPTQAGTAERAQVFALADKLFHNIGLQLSAKLYGASNWERGANLDRIDIPLNDRVWLKNRFTEIRQLPGEAAKLAAIEQILHWSDPAPRTLYDDLGDPANEPHLMRGKGFAGDPEQYQTAIDGVSDHTPLEGVRWSQLTYAETLYETPLELAYDHLDPARHYRLRVTFGGEDYTAPIGIVANHTVEIEPLHDRKFNPETLEFEIPQAAITTGSLTIEVTRPQGTGGSGRGHQVAEVWLIPEP